MYWILLFSITTLIRNFAMLKNYSYMTQIDSKGNENN